MLLHYAVFKDGLLLITVFSMSEAITKQDIKELREGTRQDIHALREATKHDLETSEAKILGSVRDLNMQFVKSQGLQNDRLERIEQEVLEANTKLNAIMDALATRQEVRNLVRELRGQGLTLDESKIFVA